MGRGAALRSYSTVVPLDACFGRSRTWALLDVCISGEPTTGAVMLGIAWPVACPINRLARRLSGALSTLQYSRPRIVLATVAGGVLLRSGVWPSCNITVLRCRLPEITFLQTRVQYVQYLIHGRRWAGSRSPRPAVAARPSALLVVTGAAQRNARSLPCLALPASGWDSRA